MHIQHDKSYSDRQVLIFITVKTKYAKFFLVLLYMTLLSSTSAAVRVTSLRY